MGATRALATALILTAAVAVAPPCARAAGTTVTNADRNLLIRVQDALPVDGGTRLLYVTSPDITQAHAGEPCTANFYVLDLRPGLPAAAPKRLAGDFCGYFGMSGTFLESGDVLLVAGDRVETRRPGAGKVKAWRLSDVAALKGPWKQVNDGNTPLDVARDGTVVLARAFPRARGDTTTASAIAAGLSPDGALRWRLELAEPGVRLGVMDIWATADGGALLDVNAAPMTGSGLPGAEAPPGAIVTGETRLYRVSATGALSKPVVIARQQMPDPTAPVAMPDPAKDPAAFQAAFQAQLALSRGNVYTAGQVAAHPRADGSVDVLAGRGTTGARLVRLDRDGSVVLDKTLDAAVAEEGLRPWTDFATDGDRIVLYGALGTRANRLSQGYFSWIGLTDGGAVTRLAPLDERGLEAARNARDEQVQYLEDNPAQQPQMLTRLGDRPLAVALVTRAHRPAIQLDEGTDALAVYTEAKDARRAEAEKAARREARKADREARHAQLNSDLAAAAGVSPEAFAAMSGKERKAAMLRSGNLDAVMAAMNKQADMARASAEPPEPPPDTRPMPSPAEMNAQVAAAMAEAQRRLAAQGIAIPGMPGGPAADVLKLDADRRGRIDFRSPDGGPVTLLVLDRGSGKELLKKTYPDGTIHESVAFGAYDVPLDRIDVLYRNAAGRTLAHPALVAGNP